MPFNAAIFKTRALTAIVFAILMLTGLLWNQWSYLILFTIIHFGCWYEFIKLLKKIKPLKTGYFVPLGLIYITLPCLLMMYLGFPGKIHRVTQTGNANAFTYLPNIPCIIIFSIWINDTMAYIVGSLLGKTPFSKISPKKTWEGTIGGAVLCVLLVGYIVAPFVYQSLASNATPFTQPAHWFVIAGICAVFGTLGDLFESKLKRMAAVKDSGTFMPGHGGFLDRFDSLLVATPFVWLYVYFFCLKY